MTDSLRPRPDVSLTWSSGDRGTYVWRLDPDWRIDGRLVIREGEILVESVHVTPAEDGKLPGRGVDTRLMRMIRPADLRMAVAARLKWYARGVSEQALAAAVETVGRGRRRRDTALLRLVAEVLIDESHRGPGARGRTADRVASALGLKDVPEGTLRDWIKEARARGYLAPGSPGVRDARPGPALIAADKSPKGRL